MFLIHSDNFFTCILLSLEIFENMINTLLHYLETIDVHSLVIAILVSFNLDAAVHPLALSLSRLL